MGDFSPQKKNHQLSRMEVTDLACQIAKHHSEKFNVFSDITWEEFGKVSI